MSTALAELQSRIKAELEAVRTSVAPPSGNKISTKDKKFTLPDGKSEQILSVVILDHRNLNRYYIKPYDSQKIVPPDCYALAKTFNTLSPKNHEDVASPQHEDCASCPYNQFGSAPNGKGKACRNMVRLAVIPPDADESVSPMTLEIPPSALKNWNKLVNDLESTGLLPIQIVTEISFDPKVTYPCPVFTPKTTHDNLQTLWTHRERAQAMLDASPAG
jgi:hypothetical protein